MCLLITGISHFDCTRTNDYWFPIGSKTKKNVYRYVYSTTCALRKVLIKYQVSASLLRDVRLRTCTIIMSSLSLENYLIIFHSLLHNVQGLCNHCLRKKTHLSEIIVATLPVARQDTLICTN